MQLPACAFDAALAPAQQGIIDRLIEACLTGKECRTSDHGPRRWAAISPGGLGLLARHSLWRYAAERIAELSAVHPRAQYRFLDVWMRVGWMLRRLVADDDVFFPMLRKLLPAYTGGPMTLYRGQAEGGAVEPSWTRAPHIALKFALWGDANVNPHRLVLKGTPAGGRNDAVVLKAVVAANRIISAPCLLGMPEGEYIVDPRHIEFTSEPAPDAGIWIKEWMEGWLAP
ncbi:hypothetical protein BSZ19_04040 [Bradyrhizobium japonicum]|uniref:Uncharacterized protein n=1 Tax=Bradyrhizobium japonicum TaxID=375 RepID=A0A1Y2JXX0_BRAJP|nr:hypothetical protein [Bradyrhizobium japonicum]OSJ36479.1 hypothetical protein BSZ19_04040 [Bradyrhizobium japonicum]